MPKTTPAANGEADHEALALLHESATPDLYLRNGFRVLELPVDATAKDVNRRKQLVEMATTNGVSLPPGSGRSFPLEPAPDEFTVRDAVHRLGDPERRLVDEFFWFWPHEQGQSKSDQGLQHLVQGNHERASEIWSQQEANQSVSHVSTHNLAVLHHLLVLQWESYAQSSDITEDEQQNIEQLWSRAFRRWQKLLAEEGFWSRLTARVREFQDPRLTAGTVHRLQAALPAALLSINARLALQAVERGKKDSAARLVEVIRKSGFPEDAIKDGLCQAVEPVRARIKALCKAAERAAETDPVHLDKVCRQLLENAIPLLDGLDCLLPTGDPTREVAHDDVAEQVLKCQLAFVKKTENWRVSVELLEMVSPVASSKTISKKIEENLQAVRKNAESNDSFCGEGYFDLPPAHLEEMEDARRLTEQQDFDKALASLETLPRNDLMACPHCRTGLDWTQQRAGSTLNCPFCSREFQAPESAEVFPPESRFLIDKALAHCLLTRGLQRVNQVGAEGGQLIPTLKRIIERLKSNPSALLLAGLGGSGLGRYGARSCMACSCSISPYENHVSFTFKNVPMVVCSSCGAQLQREEDSRKSNLRDAVRASAEDLVRAAQLDPANKLVEQQLGQLREVCSNVGVSFPQAPKAKKPRVSKTPSVPVTSEQSAEAATSGGCKAANWSLGLGFVGAFFSFPLLGGIFDPAYGKSVAAGDFTGTTILASVLAIPAILCGHFALRQIARLNGNSHARTRAKGGLLCGYGALVLLVIAWLVRSST